MQKQELLYYPELLTNQMLDKYPDFYEFYKSFLPGGGNADMRVEDGWPDWCQVPVACASSYIMQYHMFTGLMDIAKLHAYASWNTQKIILDVDETLLSELDFDGEIRQEILYQLPFYCPYIALPKDNDLGIDGFFCWLEYDADSHGHELRIMDCIDGKFYPYYASIDPSRTMEDATLSDIERDVFAKIVPPFLAKRSNAKFVTDRVKKHLPIIMYIVSQDRDMVERETDQRRKKKPQKAASGPRIYDVGAKIGGAIRHYQSQEANHQGGTVRPHIRRAHWHSYWVGPKATQQKLIVKWLPPIPVGMGEENETERPTIRPVK